LGARVEDRVLVVGISAHWVQQEEGFSFGEGKHKGGYEVQLEAERIGEFDASRVVCSILKLVQLTDSLNVALPLPRNSPP